MKIKLKQQDVLAYFSNEDFTSQTIQQIKKDFNLGGYELLFDDSETLTYQHLLNELRKTVAFLCEQDFAKFASILYRMDISERVVAEITAVSNANEVYDNLSELILLTEAKKVIIRNYLSQKS